MTLLFKQSRETNKETLCVKLGDDQGIMLKIQAGCVSWLVNLLKFAGRAPIAARTFLPSCSILWSKMVQAKSTVLARLQQKKVSLIPAINSANSK